MTNQSNMHLLKNAENTIYQALTQDGFMLDEKLVLHEGATCTEGPGTAPLVRLDSSDFSLRTDVSACSKCTDAGSLQSRWNGWQTALCALSWMYEGVRDVERVFSEVGEPLKHADLYHYLVPDMGRDLELIATSTENIVNRSSILELLVNVYAEVLSGLQDHVKSESITSIAYLRTSALYQETPETSVISAALREGIASRVLAENSEGMLYLWTEGFWAPERADSHFYFESPLSSREELQFSRSELNTALVLCQDGLDLTDALKASTALDV